MKKYSRVVLAIGFKSAIAYLAYLYLWGGDNEAGNILKFCLTFSFSINVLLVSVQDARSNMSAKGRDLPAWMGELFGYALASALAYHGHFIYAGMAIMIPIFSVVIYGQKTKEASNA